MRPQKRYLSASDEELRAAFLQLTTPRELASLLEVSYAKLVYYALTNAQSNYQRFSIRKKGGGERVLSAPVSPLKIIQKKLCQILSAVYVTKGAVHGFVADRSIVSNAERHVGKKYVLNLDLENFFGVINFGRVRGLFMGEPYGLPATVATLLAQICCHGTGLPQGAPTSPIISNMICRRLDHELSRYTRRRGCVYTRYADDITISTYRERFPDSLASVEIEQNTGQKSIIIAEGLNAIIAGNGFSVNYNKVRLSPVGQRQEVTGLIVNKKINVTRNYRNQIRTMLYAWKKFGLSSAAKAYFQLPNTKHRLRGAPSTANEEERLFRRILRGRIEFLRMVRGPFYHPYQLSLKRYKELNPGSTLRIPEISDEDARHPILGKIESHIWLIEDCYDNSAGEAIVDQATAFMLDGIGLVTCNHAVTRSTVAVRNSMEVKTVEARKVWACERTDLAILRFDDEEATASYLKTDIHSLYNGLKPNRHRRPRSTEEVFICGYVNYHVGDRPALLRGQIVGTKVRSMVKHIQVDILIESGMSGGPMIDKHGLVRGVAIAGIQTKKPQAPQEYKLEFGKIDSGSQSEPITSGPIEGILTLFSRRRQQELKRSLASDISIEVANAIFPKISYGISEFLKQHRIDSPKIELTNERYVIGIDMLYELYQQAESSKHS